jgi:hypothetical protein
MGADRVAGATELGAVVLGGTRRGGDEDGGAWPCETFEVEDGAWPSFEVQAAHTTTQTIATVRRIRRG